MEKVKLSLRKFWKRIIAAIVAITLLFAGIVVIPILFPATPPTGNTIQASFTSTASDGFIRASSFDHTWGVAYDAATGTTFNITGASGLAGGTQTVAGTTYFKRAFVYFPTNSTGIPTGVTVTSVILEINFTINTGTYTFAVFTPETSYTYPSTPMVDADYSYLYYDTATSVGNLSSTSITTNVYNNITLATSSVNLTANTKLILRTYEEYANATGWAGNVTAQWNANANETTTGGPPKLYVTYTIPISDSYGTDVTYAGYNVTFYSHWATDSTANLTTASYGNFTWNGTGASETFTGITLSSGWCNYSRLTPSTVGVVVQYSFAVNDSGARTGSTGDINLVLTTAMWTLIKEKDASIGVDDVFQNSTSYYKTTQTLQLGYDGTNGANVSLKFVGYNNSAYLSYLQRGAHIDNATLQFRGNTSASGNNPYVRIQGCTALTSIAADTWSNIGASTFARTKTVAYTDWQLPDTTAGTDVSSPNFASVMQELVNLAGWTIGGNISLFLMYMNGTGQRFFNAQETGQTGTYARLYLEWDWTPQIISYSTNVTIACNRTIAYGFKVFNYRSLQYAMYEWNVTNSFVNSTAFAVTAATYPFYWANFSADMGTADLWSVNVTVYCNETVGGVWYGHTPYNLKPLYGYYVDSDLGTLDYSGSQMGFAHNTGRHLFYDNNTNSYVAFYSNGSNICYAFSLDGINWQNKTSFIAFGTIGDHSYQYLRNLQGKSYVDVQYGAEGMGSNFSVYYRRGQIEANHSITWHAVWQSVHLEGASERAYPEGIVTDSQNVTYMAVENCTGEGASTDNLTMWLYKNSATDGTWSTASGFPLNITSHDTSAWECIMMVHNNDTVVVVMTGGDLNQDTESSFTSYVEAWYCNGTAVWYENASDTATCWRDCSGALIDNAGRIHIVYRDAAGQIKYVYKTSLGVWQTGQLVWDRDMGPIAQSSRNTIPQLTYDAANERLFCSWNSNETYLYVSYRVIGAGNVWTSLPKRIGAIPAGVSSNTAINQNVTSRILFGQQSGSTYTLYTYYYDTSKVTWDTPLVIGWNQLATAMIDVGRTLGEINSSLYIDNINWTMITIDYLNGTQWSMQYGTSYNANCTVTTSSKMWIYCLDVTATWTHTYE